MHLRCDGDDHQQRSALTVEEVTQNNVSGNKAAPRLSRRP
jgi:hypothetical protein